MNPVRRVRVRVRVRVRGVNPVRMQLESRDMCMSTIGLQVG